MQTNTIGKRILFGHQSVGENILSGISSLDPSIDIRKLETATDQLTRPGIYHMQIGENGYPLRKIEHFDNVLRNSNIEFDIALMKLCYVDINARTDVTGLFEQYVASTTDLSRKLPHTRLVHCTIPIRVLQPGVRTLLKRLSGRTIEAFEANKMRDKFNCLMRREYTNNQLLDIARLEATRPDGSDNSLNYSGHRVPAMFPAYSSDGGHLSDRGRTIIATEFLRLTELSE
jgi:hypothetical protein